MDTLLIVAYTCFVDTFGADVIDSPRDNMIDVQMVVIYMYDLVMDILLVCSPCSVDCLGADVITSPRDNMRDVQIVSSEAKGSIYILKTITS